MAASKQRKTFLLFVILVCLVSYWWITQPGKKQREEIESRFIDFLPGLTQDQLTRIEVIKPEGAVNLEKREGIWKVVYAEGESYPIVESYLDTFFSSFLRLGKAEVVSKNENLFEKFQVREDNGLKLALYAGDEKPTYYLYLGKRGPLMSSQYVRFKGSSEVLLIKEFVSPFIDRSLSNWRDKQILSFEREKIRKFSFGFQKWGKPRFYELEFDSEDKTWTMKKPFESPAELGTVNKLAARLANLKAVDFASKEEARDLASLGLEKGRETLNISILLDDEEQKTLLLGNQTEEGNYYLKLDGNEVVYIINPILDSFLEQNTETLRKKN